MKRLWILFFEIFFCAVAFNSLSSCLSDEPRAQFTYLIPEEEADGGGGLPQKSPDENQPAAENRRDLPSSLQPKAPEKNQPPEQGEETASYTVQINLYADCEINPVETAVAKASHDNALCERIVATAVTNHHEALPAAAAKFDWHVANPDAIELECPAEFANSLCRPIGKQDVFDLATGAEPQAQVGVCVTNVCPKPKPEDCEDIVCASVKVFSVVNLRGRWNLSGTTFEQGENMQPTQDRRYFNDDHLMLDHGLIVADSAQFEIDDYLYKGKIEPSRNQMHGNVIEMMGLSVIGTWEAERLDN